MTLLAYTAERREAGAHIGRTEGKVRLYINCCTAIAIVVFQVGGVLSGLNFAGDDIVKIPDHNDITAAIGHSAFSIAAKDSDLMHRGVQALVNSAIGPPLLI